MNKVSSLENSDVNLLTEMNGKRNQQGEEVQETPVDEPQADSRKGWNKKKPNS
jgi:hypothetical protein